MAAPDVAAAAARQHAETIDKADTSKEAVSAEVGDDADVAHAQDDRKESHDSKEAPAVDRSSRVLQSHTADGSGDSSSTAISGADQEDDNSDRSAESDHSGEAQAKHDDAGSPESHAAGTDAAAESLRRKRDREGSLEPSLSQRELRTTDALPSKKNRLVQETPKKEATKVADAMAEPRTSFEGEKVGQIRKRVQDLSWKQRKEGDRDDGLDEEEAGAEVADASAALASDAAPTTAKPDSPPPLPARKQATFSSFSSKTSGFGAAPKPSASIFEDSSNGAAKPASPPSTASRTQPTFSSFSKSSSPFNTATASIAGPSWLAGKSSGGGSGSGIRPSNLGSMGHSEADRASSSPRPASKDPPAASTSSKGLGFGAFAASKSFAAGAGAGSSRSSTPSSSDKETVAKGEDGAVESNSFDEALRREDAGSASRAPDRPKVTTQAERGEVDLRTGEEDEQTIASVRAKLFTMADDKSWKERGTGTVRCNVGKDDASSGGRLVMRAEGVLRLILNIKLFKGMGINLEQDKFIRIVALEDGKTTTFAIKVGNASAAGQFYRTVKSAIPREEAAESAA